MSLVKQSNLFKSRYFKMFSIANVAEEVRVSHTGKCGFNCMNAQLGIGEAELFRSLIEMKNRPTVPVRVKAWCLRVEAAWERAIAKKKDLSSLDEDCWLTNEASKCKIVFLIFELISILQLIFIANVQTCQH
jgi:hypothetical protein